MFSGPACDHCTCGFKRSVWPLTFQPLNSTFSSLPAQPVLISHLLNYVTVVKIQFENGKCNIQRHKYSLKRKKTHSENSTSSFPPLHYNKGNDLVYKFSGLSALHRQPVKALVSGWGISKEAPTLWDMHEACRLTKWWQKPQQEVAVRPHSLLSPASCSSVEQVLVGSRSFPLL